MEKEDVKILIAVLFIAALIATLTGLYIKFEVIQKNYCYTVFSEESIEKFDVFKLGNSQKDQQIKYGYDLITNTPKYFGSEAPADQRYAGNNLACKNCHLKSGKKAFSMPFIGVSGRFPQFLARENRVETLEDRINGCMERSLNGKPLAHDSKEMQAMVAYMNWLSRDIPSNYNLVGKGFAEIDIPNRAVNLAKGKRIYQSNCAACHGNNGEGENSQKDLPEGESFCPPLWGNASFNEGAGMARVITAARFIKGNMPFGTKASHPVLTDEEAFDVAGYINSFERPERANKEKDYPNLKLKPVSTPYPPYADDFPTKQHKFGPYPEIIDYYQNKYEIKKDK